MSAKIRTRIILSGVFDCIDTYGRIRFSYLRGRPDNKDTYNKLRRVTHTGEVPFNDFYFRVSLPPHIKKTSLEQYNGSVLNIVAEIRPWKMKEREGWYLTLIELQEYNDEN
jgi:hypothetical protein